MAREGASMFDLTPQKQGSFLCKRTRQDDNDTVGEGITTFLILVLGIVSIINSIAVVVYSIILATNKHLVLMELIRTLIVAGVLLAIGLGSVLFFRKRLRALAKKKSPWEL